MLELKKGEKLVVKWILIARQRVTRRGMSLLGDAERETHDCKIYYVVC